MSKLKMFISYSSAITVTNIILAIVAVLFTTLAVLLIVGVTRVSTETDFIN
jgi:hypothetical protein